MRFALTWKPVVHTVYFVDLVAAGIRYTALRFANTVCCQHQQPHLFIIFSILRRWMPFPYNIPSQTCLSQGTELTPIHCFYLFQSTIDNPIVRDLSAFEVLTTAVRFTNQCSTKIPEIYRSLPSLFVEYYIGELFLCYVRNYGFLTWTEYYRL